jgi:hypothetical protein
LENPAKSAQGEINDLAGPLRAPWRIVPEEVIGNSKKIAAYWKTLCEKYPLVKEAARKTA